MINRFKEVSQVMEKLYAQCDGCGIDIFIGDRVCEFTKSLEIRSGSQVEVLECEDLMMLCGDCGTAFTKLEKIDLSRWVKFPLRLVRDDPENEFCDGCGSRLRAESNIAVIDLAFGSMEWNTEYDMPEFAPDEGRVLAAYCLTCDDRFDDDSLRNVLIESIKSSFE